MSTDINIKKKIAISEESTIITTDVSSIDFVGAGVTASTIGNDVTVTINGAPTGVTSVGLSMPSAFSVSNSPIISSGTIAVTGAGTVSQYVRGDGTLANFPNSTGGGASVNYYLNGSVSQGTFGGAIYYQMSKTPILGAGTNFTRTNGAGNGYIASFITDAGDPSLLNIPGGNWNLEFYFQASASGNSPQFYAEIYKVSATNVFTLVASGSANPEGITNGTTVDQYFTSIPVPQTSLLITDRLAIRIYVITSGRTITLHTENGNLCEVLTTFTTGLTALNGLTSQVQYFATGTSGIDFNITSATDTHTFNIPTASATNRGALSSANWTTFNNKVGGSGTINKLSKWTPDGSSLGDSQILDDGTTLAIGTAPSATIQFLIQSNKSRGLSVTGLSIGVYGEVNFTGANGNYYGLYGSADNVTGSPTKLTYGVFGEANGGRGVFGISSSNGYDNVGVEGKASDNGFGAPGLNIGGKFTATGATANYGVQIIDGTEGTGKYLKCVDGSTGYANWAAIPVAFSPQDVSSADTAPTAASTQYYYQTISTVTGTISKVKLWGFSGTDLVRFGIYRGILGGSMTLIGQGSATCVTGPNEISLTAEVGQTLNLVVGENLVVGYYADGTSWRTIYDIGISDVLFGITNTTNITTMPATPTGTATGIRFACTLYS